MRRGHQNLIFFLILILAAGFATVTTTLIANGTARVGGNTADFDVYFSAVSTETGGTATINQSTKREITFSTKTLMSVNDMASLSYTVTNNSAQYDANVSVSFTATNVVNGDDYSDYYRVSRSGFDTSAPTSIPGKSSLEGRIVITLLKPVEEDVQISFILTLNVNATERTTEAVLAPVADYSILSGDLSTVGSVVRVANEEFYVIGQEDSTHVKLLSKYNLNVGNNVQDAPEGLQSSLATGNNDSPSTKDANGKYPATVLFSSTNYWYGNGALLPEYGSTYPAWIYRNTKSGGVYLASIAQYVDNYVDYLNSHGVTVTGRLINYEELVALGCDDSLQTCNTTGGATAPAWVHQTSYWVGSGSHSDCVWYVYKNGEFHYRHYYNDYTFGVRPLIIMEIENE